LAILAGVLAPPDRHICATTGSSERLRPDSGGIGYAVLMEVKGVNSYQILNSWTLFTIQNDTTFDTIDEIDK